MPVLRVLGNPARICTLWLSFSFAFAEDIACFSASRRSAAPGSAEAARLKDRGRRRRRRTFDDRVVPARRRTTNGDSPARPPSSVGEAVRIARTSQELLRVASTLWLPSDPDLPSHLRAQAVHHEKRQRWSSQLISKLGSAAAAAAASGFSGSAWSDDDRLSRAVLAAALPFDGRAEDWPEKEGRSVREALRGLHALAGRAPPVGPLRAGVREGVRVLLERAERMAPELALNEVVEMRWAARGLVTRLGPQVAPSSWADGVEESDRTQEVLARLLPNLEARVAGLPFDIVPLAVDWSKTLQSVDEGALVPTLRDSIPFCFDTIVTRTGSSVKERRGTAWVAEDGIGALAYSGKLMPPSPLPEVVRAAMRAVESSLDLDGPFFDCALCNHYPDGEAACKFHTDPEHGTFWERLTCVVAAGEDRRFAFRPIPQVSTWSEWERPGQLSQQRDGAVSNTPAVANLFPGDVVKMWGTCNDDFHHAVYPRDNEEYHSSIRDGRISLVLKRAIDRGGGRQGHGLKGEGRRSRRRQTRDPDACSSILRSVLDKRKRKARSKPRRSKER